MAGEARAWLKDGPGGKLSLAEGPAQELPSTRPAFGETEHPAGDLDKYCRNLGWARP